jgi:hypothetical protein
MAIATAILLATLQIKVHASCVRPTQPIVLTSQDSQLRVYLHTHLQMENALACQISSEILPLVAAVIVLQHVPLALTKQHVGVVLPLTQS